MLKILNQRVKVKLQVRNIYTNFKINVYKTRYIYYKSSWTLIIIGCEHCFWLDLNSEYDWMWALLLIGIEHWI